MPYPKASGGMPSLLLSEGPGLCAPNRLVLRKQYRGAEETSVPQNLRWGKGVLQAVQPCVSESVESLHLPLCAWPQALNRAGKKKVIPTF